MHMNTRRGPCALKPMATRLELPAMVIVQTTRNLSARWRMPEGVFFPDLTTRAIRFSRAPDQAIKTSQRPMLMRKTACVAFHSAAKLQNSPCHHAITAPIEDHAAVDAIAIRKYVRYLTGGH